MAVKIQLAGGRFYQNVRRLLCFWRRQGRTVQTPDEVVQFTSVLSLDAPSQEVESLQLLTENEQAHRHQMAVHHYGLLGTHGAMPLRYTEWLIERRYRYGDESAKAFIDIFTHRLLSLRFQAWQKYRLYARAEQLQQHFIPSVLPAQLGLQAEHGSLPVALNSIGLLATPVRTFVNLQHLLQREFAMPVDVVPFQPCWRRIEPEYRCQLGVTRLGSMPMLGTVYRDIRSRFLVRLGPLTSSQRTDFMPGTPIHHRLVNLVRQFSGPLMEFSLELLIKHDKKGIILNGKNQLGWSGSLGNEGPQTVQRLYLKECAT